MARILIIERTGAFSDALKKRYEVTTVPNGKDALKLVKECEYTVVVLDAISMRTPGERIARQLSDGLGAIPLIHLHPGPQSSANSPADVVLFLPFTARKIINTIERLLHPVGDEAVVTCGPFSVNLARRVLTAGGQETVLTPKLALLVETFLRHPGETLSRKTLMERVWDTSYLGDTRTLDVHIRWIRRVIEQDPGKPQYLKTVRGVGYRLEIPAETPASESTAATLQEA
ncbi:MAG TPA: response regulator transcription factor [Phototrophicaceae bacterium]|nr:response regulator transcription factor [Phototrophicaceae bacterium]